MNFFLITTGTRGDVQPFVALAQGLLTAGHRVVLCTNERFRGFVEDAGVPYAFMDDGVLRLIDSDAGRQATERAGRGAFGWFKTTLNLLKDFRPILRSMLEEQWAAADAFQTDCAKAGTGELDAIVCHVKAMGGLHIAAALGVTCYHVLPFPAFVATGEFPMLVAPELFSRSRSRSQSGATVSAIARPGKLARLYNRWTYKLVPLMSASYAGILNAFRRDVLKLKARSAFRSMLLDDAGRAVPVLHCYSSEVIPRPLDWPETAHVTGYWTLADSAGAKNQASTEITPELSRFIEAGAPPVYIGFGSMTGNNPARVARIVVDALRLLWQAPADAGRPPVRLILATGWGGLDAEVLKSASLPADRVLLINGAPHGWLFPRVAAVVHHGGAGTTAAGLRSGRPTVICPFFGDQPFWGRRVARLGVGPDPIPQAKLSPQKLARAIEIVISDPEMRARAAAIGTDLMAENGVAQAVAILGSDLPATSQ